MGWRWCARLGLVAAMLAVVELVIATLLIPLMSSSLVGLAATLHLLIVTYSVTLIPVVAIATLLERRFGGRLAARFDALEPQAIVSQLVGLVIAVGLVLWLAGIATRYPEFPGRMSVVVASLALAAACAVVVSARLLLRPLLEAAARRRSQLGKPRVVLGLLGMVIVVGMIAISYVGFGALLLPALSATVAAAAAALALVSSATIRHTLTPRRSRIAAALLAFLVLAAPVSSCRHPLGSYLFHNHSLAGGALAAELLVLADVDDDGAVTPWLGGTDCAPFDDRRGPGRIESPGDGIDQDCVGGDAAAEPAASPPSGHPLARFGCEPAELRGALLVVLDTVRADALAPRLTPALEAFRAEALDFRRAYSPAASTIQSMSALLTGKTSTAQASPSTTTLLHQPIVMNWTLPRALAATERRVFAVQNLELPTPLLAGFDRGFPWWLDSSTQAKQHFEAAAVTNEAIRILSNLRGASFFGWVHYTDAHAPYLPLVGTGGLEEASLYEREIAYVDMHVGRLLTFLERTGQASGVAVVVTADHGEELGARLVEGHGRYLYESSVHVPLLVRVPGCTALRIDEPVSLTQVAPTLARLFAARSGERPVSVPARSSSLGEQVSVVVETLDRDVSHRAVIGERFKLIVDLRYGGRVLFDLESDPDETTDVLADYPEIAASLLEVHQRFLDGVGALPASSSPPTEAE